RPRVGRPAADDHLRLVLLGQGQDLVVVDHVRLARDAVVGDRVEPAAEVDLQAVGEVAAVRELEREDRVARLQRRHVHGHVRLRAGVRLDVRVLGAEQLLRTVDRRLLDLVDDLAAAVVAPPGVALGVLVGRHRPDGLEDRGPGEVLGGDQLDLAALALVFLAEQLRDVRVELGQARGAEVLDRLLCDRHCPGWYCGHLPKAARAASSACSAGTAPSRRNTRSAPREASRRFSGGTAPSRSPRGSSAVRSSTVDGVPGSSPPSTSAPTPARISGGTSASVRVSGPPCRCALGATTGPTWPSTSRVGAGSSGTRTPIVPSEEPVSQGNRPAGVGSTSVYCPGSSTSTTARGSSGTSSSNDPASAARSASGCSAGLRCSR